MVDRTFDTKQFKYIDFNLRDLVDAHYELCTTKCTEKPDTFDRVITCRNNCYKSIVVPYKYVNHMAKDAEEREYKKCLASKMPNIKHDDYLTCTQNVYHSRVSALSEYMAGVSE